MMKILAFLDEGFIKPESTIIGVNEHLEDIGINVEFRMPEHQEHNGELLTLVAQHERSFLITTEGPRKIIERGQKVKRHHRQLIMNNEIALVSIRFKNDEQRDLLLSDYVYIAERLLVILEIRSFCFILKRRYLDGSVRAQKKLDDLKDKDRESCSLEELKEIDGDLKKEAEFRDAFQRKSMVIAEHIRENFVYVIVI